MPDSPDVPSRFALSAAMALGVVAAASPVLAGTQAAPTATTLTGTLPDGATWQQGDVTDTGAARQIAAANDVVVSAFGPSREPGGDPGAAHAARPTADDEQVVAIGCHGSRSRSRRGPDT